MQFNLIKISNLFRNGDFALHPHALQRMEQRDISSEFLLFAIGEDHPEIIEEYNYSCLILGWNTSNKPLHVVVSLGTVDFEYDTPIVITAYKPDEDEKDRWTDNYAIRKEKK
jgi:hypothetical protein